MYFQILPPWGEQKLGLGLMALPGIEEIKTIDFMRKTSPNIFRRHTFKTSSAQYNHYNLLFRGNWLRGWGDFWGMY